MVETIVVGEVIIRKQRFTPYNTTSVETDRNFRQIQTSINQIYDSTLIGKVIEVSLVGGAEKQISVGFKCSGFHIVDKDANSDIWRTRPLSEGLFIVSSNDVNIKLFVF
jgi:hypothetical protein